MMHHQQQHQQQFSAGSSPTHGIGLPPPPHSSVLLGGSASAHAAATDDSYEPAFGDHVNSLRSTMFYVCQGSCLCGTVNNRGKVIYCYGDLVPRHGELFAEGAESGSKTTSKDLLAAQLGVWTFGIVAL